MKVLSLFSGVGGFDLGLEAAGMETVFQCEWDKHATKILERHWPNVPKWGDVSTLTAAHILSVAPVVDVVAWGSPCQDLSVAGKRAGLGGERSGLFHQGIRIIKEIRELTNGKYPRMSVWENVAGALSSGGGADFGEVLYEMDEAGACFSEWRMLDAQYFGVPQRRRRVFVVSVFDPGTAARCPDPLLPLEEGVRGDTAEGATTREGVAGAVVAGIGGRNQDVTGCLTARDHKGADNIYAEENKLVVEPFTGSSHAQYTEGVGTLRANGGDLAGGSETLLVEPTLMRQPEGKPGGGKGPLLSTNVSLTLAASNDQTLFVEDPVFFQMHQSGDTRIQDGVMHTLAGYMGTGGNNTPMVAIGIQGNVIGRQDHNGPAGKGHTEEGEPMFTLNTTDRHAVAYNKVIRSGARDANGELPPEVWAEQQVAPTISTFDQGEVRATTIITEPIGFSHTQGLSAQPSEQAFPMLRREGSGMAVSESTMTVRRLTPLECERLMGWPDDWTAGQSDTHRYKQCGNGVASPVAQWIGQQLINL